MINLPKQVKSSKGFTLIELLVVIAIMGVLMVGALVAINPQQKINQAKDANGRAAADQISSAMQSYYTTNQTYPDVITDLTAASELQNIPNTPQGSAFSASNFLAQDSGSGACDGTSADACTKVSLYFTELAPSSSSAPIYCWKSATGTVTHVASPGSSNCTP